MLWSDFNLLCKLIMIPVNKPFLPPKSEYEKYLEGIWDRNWLTNNGELVQSLENKVREHLGSNRGLYVTNGTIALQIAIKALKLSGEVITTPFSYVATSSSLVWEGCQPVFADVDSKTFNVAPEGIESLINSRTTGILVTHVFGNPCDLGKLAELAVKHNLKLIYDAAHAFGVKVDGKSIFDFGDVSTASLHSTKVFHSVEGGLVFPNSVDPRTIELMRNFGHDGPHQFSEVGINGKNSELHAAMGLANLNHMAEILEQRERLYSRYVENLTDAPVVFQEWNANATRNYAYMPILLDSEAKLLKLISTLESKDIYGRRYFYPTLDELPYLKQDANIHVAKDIASRIFCLPLYFDLSLDEVDRVCEVICAQA